MRLGKPILIEWPARGKKLYEFKADFLETLEPIKERILKARNPQAEEITRHIIGIERWGQRRLSVAWGQPLVMTSTIRISPLKGSARKPWRLSFTTPDGTPSGSSKGYTAPLTPSTFPTMRWALFPSVAGCTTFTCTPIGKAVSCAKLSAWPCGFE